MVRPECKLQRCSRWTLLRSRSAPLNIALQGYSDVRKGDASTGLYRKKEILVHARLRPEVPGAAVYHVRRVVRTCAQVIEWNRARIFRLPSLFVTGVVLVVLALGYLGEWEV